MGTAPTKPGRDDARIDHEASEWFVELQSDSVAPERLEEFERWIAADPRHAEAFEDTRSCWADLGTMSAWASTEPGRSAREMRSCRLFSGLAEVFDRFNLRVTTPLFALTILAAILVVRFVGDGGRVEESYVTRVAETRKVVLDDGSVVTLGARSSVDVRFTRSERRMVLNFGEAFFDVAKDASRPFIIDTDEATVRAVGTQFDVRSYARKVHVSVVEGIVEVSIAGARAATEPSVAMRTLVAGQAVSAADGALGEVRSSASPGGAWREGWLMYEDATLDEVVADMNRYYDGTVELADPALAQLRVTASFRSDRIDHMIDTLVLGFPLQANRPAPGRIVLAPKAN